MLILPQQRLGFLVLQETGLFKGHSIGGGWLAMPADLPNINDQKSWERFIHQQPPLMGVFTPCDEGQVITLQLANSVRSTFLALHPLFKSHSPVTYLRVILMNSSGERCLSIVLQEEELQVPDTLN